MEFFEQNNYNNRLFTVQSPFEMANFHAVRLGGLILNRGDRVSSVIVSRNG